MNDWKCYVISLTLYNYFLKDAFKTDNKLDVSASDIYMSDLKVKLL